MKDRAYRRAKLAAIKAKRARMAQEKGWQLDGRSRGMLAHTGTLCSCQMCRNPRTSKLFKRKAKLTKQELLAEQAEV